MDDGWVDEDLTGVRLVGLAGALVHVAWAVHARVFDRDFALAIGVGIVCLALLRPFFGWVLRRVPGPARRARPPFD